MDRPASFFPTIKCSSCGQKIEISLMGEHICSSSAAKAASPPPPPRLDTFMAYGAERNNIDNTGGRYKSNYNGDSSYGYGSRDQDRSDRLPPKVDTLAANRSYYRAGQLTPGSSNSSSSQSVSPRTPLGMIADGPQTAGLSGSSSGGGDYFGAKSPQAQQSRHPGGYGGLDAYDAYPPPPSSSPRHQRPGLAQPTLPLKNGAMPAQRQASRSDYRREEADYNPQDNFPQPSFHRAETFPRLNECAEPPARTPSAPGPRPDRARRPADDLASYSFQPYGTSPVGGAGGQPSDHTRQPSMGPDTSRPPPPRTSLLRPSTSGRNGGSFDVKTPPIDLAAEFGIGNPYHSASNSMSSTVSSVMSRPGLPFSSSLSSLSSASSFTTSSSSVASLNNCSSSSLRTSPHPGPLPRGARHDAPQDLDRGGQDDPLRREPSQAKDDLYPGGSHTTTRTASPLPVSPLSPMSPMPSRGNCKACRQLITGKSVSSADGRLTGRYHKACFVCYTCREPFSSATFYVHDDKPYCERHYHAVNGSLCGTCQVGIEGPYLADETDAKHHPNCFVCRDCKQSLRDGYFEVAGSVYCERDAQKRVQQSWQPAPSPPFPRSYPPSRGGGGVGGGGGGMGNSLAVPRGLPPSHNMSRRPFNVMPPPHAMGPAHGNRLQPSNLRPRMEKRITRLGMM
ncbi:hypothetical protein SEPCBS119000_000294 [Sporothrix epigloea]|uniref:LIM zinc-binding domain-containing protein n=1 Tax=Sporothrix epigloea TaxID=1892477 RepID=A0ABP0D6U1_9PEZI